MPVTHEDIDSIVYWITQEITKARKSTAVIGISGGIDSAVISTLCVKALGKENVVGVILPCQSNIQSSEDALLVFKKLELPFKFIKLDNAYNAYVDSAGWDTRDKVSAGNIKARLRMIALYDIASAHNGLVVGTTNKTEALLGYATKYGDHGVDIEPIQDFYKTEIFEIARLLDVPEQIINKKPTADLWEGQTDEDELGLTYTRIDEILQNPDYLKVSKMIRNSEHKRNVPPSYTRQ